LPLCIYAIVRHRQGLAQGRHVLLFAAKGRRVRMLVRYPSLTEQVAVMMLLFAM
jgi:hypothetical protein